MYTITFSSTDSLTFSLESSPLIIDPRQLLPYRQMELWELRDITLVSKRFRSAARAPELWSHLSLRSFTDLHDPRGE